MNNSLTYIWPMLQEPLFFTEHLFENQDDIRKAIFHRDWHYIRRDASDSWRDWHLFYDHADHNPERTLLFLALYFSMTLHSGFADSARDIIRDHGDWSNERLESLYYDLKNEGWSNIWKTTIEKIHTYRKASTLINPSLRALSELELSWKKWKRWAEEKSPRYWHRQCRKGRLVEHARLHKLQSKLDFEFSQESGHYPLFRKMQDPNHNEHWALKSVLVYLLSIQERHPEEEIIYCGRDMDVFYYAMLNLGLIKNERLVRASRWMTSHSNNGVHPSVLKNLPLDKSYVFVDTGFRGSIIEFLSCEGWDIKAAYLLSCNESWDEPYQNARSAYNRESLSSGRYTNMRSFVTSLEHSFHCDHQIEIGYNSKVSPYFWAMTAMVSQIWKDTDRDYPLFEYVKQTESPYLTGDGFTDEEIPF